VSRSDNWAKASASALIASRRSSEMLTVLPDGVRPLSVDEGYQVQEIARSALTAQGFGRVVGWKVGCTTKVMQEYLDIAEPTAGTMFSGTVRSREHHFSFVPPRRLGVECEIAVRIGTDLDGAAGDLTSGAVIGAVSAVMAAIEVVEDRYADYPNLDTPTLVADDFFHFGAILGEERRDVDPRSLRDVTARMSINGEDVGGGKGSDILGDPLLVLEWLARHQQAQGWPLRAGDVVLLGSVVQTQWVEDGDVVTITNDPLGEARVSFSDSSL
jgi:2-keto-4-pentenoate hydratase